LTKHDMLLNIVVDNHDACASVIQRCKIHHTHLTVHIWA